jgi:hypothetical protein
MQPKIERKLSNYKGIYALTKSGDRGESQGTVEINCVNQGSYWEITEKGEFFDVEGEDTLLTNHYMWLFRTEESHAGDAYSFSLVIWKNNELFKSVRGKVTYNPLSQKGLLSYEGSYEKPQVLENIVFPTQCMQRILGNLNQTGVLRNENLFTGWGSLPRYVLSTFLPAPTFQKWDLFPSDIESTPQPIHVPLWDASLSLYWPEDSLTPFHTYILKFTEQGIIFQKDILLDDLVLNARLKRLEL